MRSPDRFVKVIRYRSPVGQLCLHCGRAATVRATRVLFGKRLAVRYCAEHADEIIDGQREENTQ